MRPPDVVSSVVVEVGPIEYWADTPNEAERNAREDRNEIERRVRLYLGVGPRSRAVRVTMDLNEVKGAP